MKYGEQIKSGIPGKSISPVGKPHRCQNRGNCRYHHVHDNGLHPCSESEHPERHGNGQRCCLYSHCPCIPGCHPADGCICQLSFCAGARHGTECLLCIHRSTPDGLYLADGSGSRICGRPYLHRTVSYQCARSYFQCHSHESETRSIRRYRAFYRLHRSAER